jgi:broad specificity phosphatase PhoE
LGILNTALPDVQKLGHLSGIDQISRVFGRNHPEFVKMSENVKVSSLFREMDFGSLEGAKVRNMTEEEHNFLFKL